MKTSWLVVVCASGVSMSFSGCGRSEQGVRHPPTAGKAPLVVAEVAPSAAEPQPVSRRLPVEFTGGGEVIVETFARPETSLHFGLGTNDADAARNAGSLAEISGDGGGALTSAVRNADLSPSRSLPLSHDIASSGPGP